MNNRQDKLQEILAIRKILNLEVNNYINMNIKNYVEILDILEKEYIEDTLKIYKKTGLIS